MECDVGRDTTDQAGHVSTPYDMLSAPHVRKVGINSLRGLEEKKERQVGLLVN